MSSVSITAAVYGEFTDPHIESLRHGVTYRRIWTKAGDSPGACHPGLKRKRLGFIQENPKGGEMKLLKTSN